MTNLIISQINICTGSCWITGCGCSRWISAMILGKSGICFMVCIRECHQTRDGCKRRIYVGREVKIMLISYGIVVKCNGISCCESSNGNNIPIIIYISIPWTIKHIFFCYSWLHRWYQTIRRGRMRICNRSSSWYSIRKSILNKHLSGRLSNNNHISILCNSNVRILSCCIYRCWGYPKTNSLVPLMLIDKLKINVLRS